MEIRSLHFNVESTMHIITRRSFLFLQGVASPFFEKLAFRLREEGHYTHRINFCGGDFFYTDKTPYDNYRGKLDAITCYLTEIFRKYLVSDIVLFGDTRQVNQPAVAIAKELGINIYAFEEGYIRPSWVTLERNGVNANSLLPKDPLWYKNTSRKINKHYSKGLDTGYSFRVRVSHDVMYRFANFMYQKRFPYFKSHRPYNGFIEYTALAKRLPSVRIKHNKVAKKTIDSLIANNISYFLFPLQLNSDSQIQVHSPFTRVKDSIKHVLFSFSRYANTSSHIVIKNHPLDTGIINYKKYINNIADKYDIRDRVNFIDGGDLNDMLIYCKGMVVVNSTSGIQALAHECPVCLLGKAIYDIKGLTSQHGLDSFWDEPEKPNKNLFNSFRDTLIYTTQVNGNLYTKKGISMTVENSLKKMGITSSKEIQMNKKLLEHQ